MRPSRSTPPTIQTGLRPRKSFLPWWWNQNKNFPSFVRHSIGQARGVASPAEQLEFVNILRPVFDRQPEAYRQSVLPPEARYDMMVVSTGTRRVWPIRDVGPLTDSYSLTSDWDNQWLTGGLEPDVIAEAHLDAASIVAGIERFAKDRDQRIASQRALL
jgi:hypothetical protein